MRKTYSGVTHAMAGCFVCHGGDAHWQSKNCMGVAARHHDATGHPTWVEQVISVRYGDKLDAPPGEQP